MTTYEVCVNSIAAVGWAWSGGKGAEEYVLGEDMLGDCLQRKGWNQRCCSSAGYACPSCRVAVQFRLYGLELVFVLYVCTL